MSPPRGTRLWHPFADMARVQGHQLVLERGEGVWVYDLEGKRYLDATAGLWYCNVGHGRERIARAAFEQSRVLAGYQTFDDLGNPPAVALAERVCELAAIGPGSAAFFTSGGSDGVETAGKVARRYWQLAGEPERIVIVAREGAYHGMHAYGTSLSGIEANASGWGRLIGDIVHVPRHDVVAVERAFEQHAGRVAAVIGEPVQGAAGVHPPSEEYWPAIQDLCRADGALLIVDEVVTGFGRLGRWFAKDRYGLEPDLLITAKGLSSGYAPIGAVIAAERVLEQLWSEQAGPFRHGYTYSGHPAACAVALENLDVLVEERLVDRVAELERPFAERLGSLASHEAVAEVRTAGLLAGVELTDAALAAGVLEAAVAEARRLGVLTRGLVGRAIQVSPPFVIEFGELDLLLESLGAALDLATRPASSVVGPS